MSEYKTFEELKEELGDEFEDYMYKANIELLNIIKEVREYIELGLADEEEAEELLEILEGGKNDDR